MPNTPIQQVNITKEKGNVIITIGCGDSYAAAILFDDLIEQLKKAGKAQLILSGLYEEKHNA